MKSQLPQNTASRAYDTYAQFISRGLGDSTAAETLICLCRPYSFEQAIRLFSHPTRLKCGVSPLKSLGFFTVFGGSPHRAAKSRGKPEQASREARQSGPARALDSRPPSHCPITFAGLTPEPMNECKVDVIDTQRDMKSRLGKLLSRL